MKRLTALRWLAAAVIAIGIAMATVALAVKENPAKIAEEYYEKSVFINGSSGPRLLAVIADNGTVIYASAPSDNNGPWDLRRGGERPAQKVEVPDEAVKRALERVGAAGELLGTYRFNSTHLVTLVAEAPLVVYAVIWNNDTAAKAQLKFEKYFEDEGVSSPQPVDRRSNTTFVKGWRIVGYVDVSGVLPFSFYSFEDESWGQFNTPGGYFKVAAKGRFRIIYGAAVYVEDLSYYELTDPMLSLCFFNSGTSGSGTAMASVKANGRAVTVTCGILGVVYDIIARVGYDAWLNRFADARGNKWFTTGCRC
ncbi:MAG: hypothetical protein ACP5H5_01550 [Pyrobaculum sp.]